MIKKCVQNEFMIFFVFGHRHLPIDFRLSDKKQVYQPATGLNISRMQNLTDKHWN